jgi:transcriptional regulator with XRE-family HTH domain
MERSLGQQLKLARQQRELSLADAAHATRVPVARLQHLEEDNLAAFGNMAYARSFARIYGQYLGVDVEPLVKTLPRPIFAGAQDYRYLTSSFGPWVEPLRKRVRVSIHRPEAGSERRRWHAFMLFVILAISTVMLGNQYLLPARSTAPARPVVPAVVPSPAAGPAVEISRPVIPVAARPKLVSYSTRSGQRPEAAPRDEQDRPNVADTAAKP